MYGFSGNLKQELRAGVGRVMSRWGDAGWGRAVADDKQERHFRDELVDAVAEMIQQRWQPDPTPRWVTCVPSARLPNLVPDYTERLAAKLGLPFAPVVAKVLDNEPQKQQQNRYHQCRNLDGVFEIKDGMPPGPVLLVDDVVDSGWTMTVVSALILRAGGGPVRPLALTSSKLGG